MPRLLGPPVAEVLRRIDAVQDGDAEARHQLRVALVRLRVALSAFRRQLQKPERKQLDGELRWLRRQFAAARDWDVFVQAQRDAALVQAAQSCRARACAQGLRSLRGRRGHALRERLRILAAHIAGVVADDANAAADGETLGALAAAAIARRTRKLQRRARHLRRMKPRDLHRLRCAAKALRYTLELFGGLLPASAPSQLRALERLQDRLGDIQDREVAVPLAAQLAVAAGRDDAPPRADRPGKRERRRLRAAWAAVAAGMP